MNNDDHTPTARTMERPERSTATQSDRIATSDDDAAIGLDVADQPNPEFAIPRQDHPTAAAPRDEVAPAPDARIVEDSLGWADSADQTAVIPAIKADHMMPPDADRTAIIPAIKADHLRPTEADQTAIIPAVRVEDATNRADQTAIIPAVKPENTAVTQPATGPVGVTEWASDLPAVEVKDASPTSALDTTDTRIYRSFNVADDRETAAPLVEAEPAEFDMDSTAIIVGRFPFARPSATDTSEMPRVEVEVAEAPNQTESGKPEIRLSRLGQAPLTLAASAAGVLIVAFAYAGGRSGASWASAAFWLGQVVVFAPIAARLFFGRLAGSIESFLLVIGLAVMQYMQKWLYSPDQFKFPDELQHWNAANILVRSGKLFQPDRALPVAVHFPGLEVMTSAVVSMTGLTVTQAGLIVAGVAHLAFIGVLFATIRRTGGSPEIAGAACIIYATALHYLFFDSMFIYQTAALPFMMLAIWASRLWQHRDRANWPAAIVVVVSVVAATASHHVTAGALVGALGLIGICEAIFARPRRWSTLIMAGGAAAIATAWFVFVAPEVFSYLEAPLRGMVSGLTGLLGGGGSSSAASGAPAPLWQLAVQALGLVVLLFLLVRAGLAMWHAPGRFDPWQVALLVGSFVFFASTGARFLGAQGPELAGRASTFVYIPMSILAAGVLVGWRPRPRGPRLLRMDTFQLKVRVPAIVHGTAIAVLLMVGARVGGWPPLWDALPGPYLASGYERGVDRQGVSAAIWTRNWLGVDHRVAADLTGVTLISTYGGQDPVGEASQLWYDATWNLNDELLLQSLAIDYLWVDTRLATQIPISGSYFPVDPQNGQHTSPIPVANLDKFDGVTGINKYYDNGSIVIYDMRTA